MACNGRQFNSIEDDVCQLVYVERAEVLKSEDVSVHCFYGFFFCVCVYISIYTYTYIHTHLCEYDDIRLNVKISVECPEYSNPL